MGPSSVEPQRLNATQASNELVLIDPAVASPRILLEGLRPGLEGRLLTADEPAPAQIARALAGRNLKAVHVIAHGQPGAVAFSGGLLDEQALEQHQQELAAIGTALGATGQVLLWCCRTAASAAGTAFVEALAQTTGVSVAASSSLVGAAARGGSWQLEGGDCSDAAAPLRPAAIARYQGVLISYSQQTGTANPFDGIDVGSFSKPSFADIDADGDLDLVVGEQDGTLNFYKNTGSATAPAYTLQIGTANPFNGFDVGFRSEPSFADIDGDGDLDLVVGEQDGTLNFYKNTGSATAPAYTLQTGTANPFDGIDVGNRSEPSFVDIDADGDPDLVVGEQDGTLNFYKNTGTTTVPAYTLQTGTANPFDGFDVGNRSEPSFADIDGDGDPDLVVGEQDGSLNFYKNTGSATAPAYTLQTGTANPFDGFDVGNRSEPSFADIDGDGDLDLVVGEQDGTLNYLLNVTCFLPGTRIATPTGERPIESLQPGDLITTADGVQPVKFLSRTRRHSKALLALGKSPVRINQGALGELGPCRDTFVSPSHAIHLDGHLVEAGALLNGSSIQQLDPESGPEFVSYFNIELEAHALIWANGMPVETYFANVRGIGFTREDWDNYDDYIALYGSSELMHELPLPRIPFARQIPASLRQKFNLLQQPLLSLEFTAVVL